MLDEFHVEKQRRIEKGNGIRQSHLLGVDQVSIVRSFVQMHLFELAKDETIDVQKPHLKIT